MSIKTNVLVIAPTTLFGFVEALPALRVIRQGYQDAALWLVAMAEHANLVSENIHCDHLISTEELTWSFTGLQTSFGLFRTKFQHVFEFDRSPRLHMLASVPASARHVHSVRGRRHPGFSALRLQDQFAELVAGTTQREPGPPSLVPEPAGEESANLSVPLDGFSKLMLTDREWAEFASFIRGMQRRGLEPQALMSAESDHETPEVLGTLTRINAHNLDDSARLLAESRLVVTADQGLAALSVAVGTPTLVVARRGVDRLRLVPRGDKVALVEIGYPIEITEKNLMSAALGLFV